MPDYALPFPTRELAEKELSYDVCYAKIPPAARGPIVEAAWEKGAAAARGVYAEQNGETDFFKIARASGLRLEEKDIDYVVGQQRYFSDYVSGKGLVTLYLRSVDLWARQNGLDRHTAENVILSHEYFHFLEWTKLGLTSKDYQVPMLQLGKLRLGRTGVRALSEIGAHAFARTYYELTEQEEQAHGKTLEG